MASGEGLDFNALYQSSLKLTTAIDDFGIPRLEKSLAQLDDASRSLYHQQQQQQQQQQQRRQPSLKKKRPAAGGSGKGLGVEKANFLLAARGIDAEKLSKELQAFELTPGFEPETALGETDIDGYLTHHHELIILSAIEDVNRRTMETTHERMNQAMIDDFERAKQSLLEDLGAAKPRGVRHYPRIAESTPRPAVQGLGLSGASFNGQPRFELSQSGSAFQDSTSSLTHGRGGGALSMSQLSASGNGNGVAGSLMDEEMKAYYSVVRELNASRIANTRTQFDVTGAFQRVCASLGAAPSGKTEAVLKCWQVLAHMLAGGDRAAISRRAPALSERAFAGSFESQDDASERARVEQRFAHGARVFLEHQFRAFVARTVQQQRLPVGGTPDLVASVRAFVRYLQSARAAGDDLGADATDVDVWALLYYCLRCGGEQEAMELASSYLRAGDSPVDESVLCALRYSVERTGVLNQQADEDASNAAQGAGWSGSNSDSSHGGAGRAFAKQFPAEYAQLVDRYHRLTSASIDAVSVVNVYERCVLNLLCGGNPNASEPRILTTIEDYLWQRLCFVESGAVASPSSDNAYTIARLAKSIHKFGPSHFEGGNSGANTPFLFFEILLIAQDFENAVKFLGSRGYLLEATHFALALHHYGLLRCAFPSPSLTTSSSVVTDDAAVDIVRLVRQYVHGFQRTNAGEAAEYVACLSDRGSKMDLLVELLLETRQFDVLAGFTNNTDGSRTRGLYDRLLKDVAEEDVRELVLQAARRAEAGGRPHDAYDLLKCAGDIAAVLALLNAQLSSTMQAPRAEREEWFRMARQFAEKWMRFPWVQGVAHRQARAAAVAFQTLLNVNIFLEIYERQQYEDAIRFVDEIEVIPTPAGNNLAICVDRFLAFDDSVRRCFHVLLLGYVESLVRDTERVKAQTAGDARRGAVTALREKAELVVTFAGMVKFRLPPGTNERLNRMEAMIY